jgi:CheY-like chemotaxis protein
MVNRKKDRHVALVVEDDLELAEEVKDLLRSLGHDVLHVPTQEEALELLETEKFCFALLDLQIKVNSDSIKPRVEAGKTLLKKIREQYPRRNSDDQHYLQILTMSGYVKETPDVVRLLQTGADDFISKPLSSNTPPLPVKIDECLQKSGRLNHSDCAAMMDLARQVNGNQASEEQNVATSKKPCLTIPGTQQGKRTEVRVGDNPVFLTNSSFVLLLKMMTLRIRKGDAWANKSDLDPSAAEGWKGMSRLNAEIRPHLPGRIDIHENDKKGGYRLNPAIEPSDMDHDQLAGHWFNEVKTLSNEIKEMRDV